MSTFSIFGAAARAANARGIPLSTSTHSISARLPLVPSPGYTVIDIDPNGDLLIELNEKESNSTRSSHTVNPEQKVAFRVDRELLVEKSEYFRTMFRDNNWSESSKTRIVLEGDTVKSMELLFRHYHGVMTPEMDTISIEEVWNVMAAGEKYQVHTEHLEGWFENWWKERTKIWTSVDGEKLDRPDWIRRWDELNGEVINRYQWMAEAMLPTYFFNHAEGFALATKVVAYEAIGVPEQINPTYHFHLRLRERVVDALKAAKGSMRREIHEGVFIKIPSQFQKLNCRCRFEGAFSYMGGILNTQIYREQHGRSSNHNISIAQTVECLNDFQYTPPQNACGYCSRDFRGSVIPAVQKKALTYFEGLCLDCLNGGYDWYERHFREGLSSDCRISHHQPTWYFSDMAHFESRSAHEAAKIRRKQEAEKRLDGMRRFVGQKRRRAAMSDDSD